VNAISAQISLRFLPMLLDESLAGGGQLIDHALKVALSDRCHWAKPFVVFVAFLALEVFESFCLGRHGAQKYA
jgi:hypothetical protein